MIVDIAGSTVELDIEDGDIITDVVVIARLQDLDRPGEEALALGCSSNTGGVLQRGMIEETLDALRGGILSDE